MYTRTLDFYSTEGTFVQIPWPKLVYLSDML